MTEIHSEGTGVSQHVPGERLRAAQKRFDEDLHRAQPRGEHVWVALVQHRVTDPAAFVRGGSLDAETVVMVHVGCYVCEEPYTERLATRRCKGEPRR